MIALKRIAGRIAVWRKEGEPPTSDLVIENLEACKDAVILDNKLLVERLRDAVITIYPAIGTAYKAYDAAQIDRLIGEILEEVKQNGG